MIQVICRMPPESEEQAPGTAWVLVSARVAEQGPWEPADGFRPWGPAEDQPAD